MCWRRCARDEEDPDICVEHSAAGFSAVVPSPAKVVQCVFWFPAKPLPEFICHQSVESRTFVNLVEVWQRFSLEKFLARLCVKDRRPISIVQQSLSKIGGGGEIFQTLLILNADRRASKLVRNSHGGDVHLQLVNRLSLRQFGLGVLAPVEFHPSAHQPTKCRIRISGRHLQHCGIERRLTESLFENTRRLQQFIWNNRIMHSHAAFIEDSHDRLAAAKIRSIFFADACG